MLLYFLIYKLPYILIEFISLTNIFALALTKFTLLRDKKYKSVNS